MESLFQRIGGIDTLNAAVEIFYKKVMGDNSLNHFFAKTNMARQKAKMKVFLTYAFGGAPDYSGKSIRHVHQHLKLTDKHFNSVMKHLRSTLEEINAPDDLKDEVMSIAASTHDDVLNL